MSCELATLNTSCTYLESFTTADFRLGDFFLLGSRGGMTYVLSLSCDHFVLRGGSPPPPILSWAGVLIPLSPPSSSVSFSLRGCSPDTGVYVGGSPPPSFATPCTPP